MFGDGLCGWLVELGCLTPKTAGQAEAFGVLERGAGIFTHSSHHHNEQLGILMPVMMMTMMMMAMAMMMCLASTEHPGGIERKKEREGGCVCGLLFGGDMHGVVTSPHLRWRKRSKATD